MLQSFGQVEIDLPKQCYSKLKPYVGLQEIYATEEIIFLYLEGSSITFSLALIMHI
jgi:hypothetical protein